MLGLILCGGKSTRMGTDKGMIKSTANTWAQSAVDKMTSLHLKVFLSVNEIQFKDYESIFKESQLIKDNSDLNVRGPMAGLLSVHLKFPTEDLLVLACDMPLMESKILQDLLLIYHRQPLADAYVFTNDDKPEPLCGIYTSKGLSFIIQILKEGKLIKHSMKFMLELMHTINTPMNENQKKYFRNFNAQAELNGL